MKLLLNEEMFIQNEWILIFQKINFFYILYTSPARSLHAKSDNSGLTKLTLLPVEGSIFSSVYRVPTHREIRKKLGIIFY